MITSFKILKSLSQKPLFLSYPYYNITASKPIRPIYARLGGETNLLKVLDIFDAKVRKDPALKPYFANTELPKILEHQRKTLKIVFGDPSGYTSRDIKSFHSTMHIKDKDWDLYIGHLRESLTQINIDKSDINEALNGLEKYHKIVVEKTIFEKLNNSTQLVRDVVNTLYDKMLTDKETRDFFLGVNLSTVKEHETQYLINLMNGNVPYQGKDVRIAHKSMDLNDRHFYIYKKHINDALRFHKVDSDIIDNVLYLLEQKRTDILNRKTPYEMLGGEIAVRQIVERMYEIIPTHPLLKNYFEEANIPNIIKEQSKFISSILGGPSYIGKDMKKIHGKMNLADSHFDAFKGCFERVLNELHLTPVDIRDCTYAFERHRREVCSISLFELLGGEPSVQRIALTLSKKIRNSNLLKKFYAYGDDDEINATLRSELMHALGGPLSFRERDIKSAHVGMFLKQEHFNEYKSLIFDAMKENGVVDNLIVQVVRILENKAFLIIDKSADEKSKQKII